MIATVEVTVGVKLKLVLGENDKATVGEIKEIAQKAATELVSAGLYHANRNVTSYTQPRLADEGDPISRKTWPITVGSIVIASA